MIVFSVNCGLLRISLVWALVLGSFENLPQLLDATGAIAVMNSGSWRSRADSAAKMIVQAPHMFVVFKSMFKTQLHNGNIDLRALPII